MNDLIRRLIKNNKVHDISKMNKIRYKTLNDVLRPINILNNIFGLRICNFTRNRSRPLISFIYSLTICCLHYIGSLYRDTQLYCNTVHHVDGIICHSTTFLNHLLLFLITIMGLCRSKSSTSCVKKLNNIDETLKELGSSISFNKVYKKMIIYLIINIFYFCLIFTIPIVRKIELDPINKSWMVYFSMLLHIYGFIIQFLLVMEFVAIVSCIKSEFQRANQLLCDDNVLPNSSIELKLIKLNNIEDPISIKKSFTIDRNKSFSNTSLRCQTQSQLQITSQIINRSKMLLRTIRQVHLELYKVSKSLGKIYGLQISLEMTMCIFLITYMTYKYYAKYQDKNMDIYEMILAIILLLEYSIKIFLIDYICDEAMKEAERTNEIIHTFYGQNMDSDIKEEVDIFFLQMMQCRTKYSAFGFYNLNCKHICSCIGIVTTYMVIVIQVTDSIKFG